MSQLVFVCIYATVGVGLLILSGFTGQASLGHAAFRAIGAYTAAYLQQYSVPFPVYFLAAGLLTGVIGALVGAVAGMIMGESMGLFGNIVIGVVGAFLGGLMFSHGDINNSPLTIGTFSVSLGRCAEAVKRARGISPAPFSPSQRPEHIDRECPGHQHHQRQRHAQPPVLAKTIAARPHHQRVALVAHRRQEIRSRARGHGHQEGVGIKVQSARHAHRHRPEQQHRGRIVQKGRTRHRRAHHQPQRQQRGQIVEQAGHGMSNDLGAAAVLNRPADRRQRPTQPPPFGVHPPMGLPRGRRA
ncbi:hypothetical protein E4T56_gene6601, partial [Termitomyces sp. T112]